MAGQERKGKKKGEDMGKDNCNQSWSLNSIDPFLNMDALSGTKFRAETHAKHIVGITASPLSSKSLLPSFVVPGHPETNLVTQGY